MDGTTTMQGTEQEVQNTATETQDSRQRKVHRRK